MTNPTYDDCSSSDAAAAEQYAVAYVAKVGVSKEAMIDAISTLRALVMTYDRKLAAAQPIPTHCKFCHKSIEPSGVLIEHGHVGYQHSNVDDALACKHPAFPIDYVEPAESQPIPAPVATTEDDGCCPDCGSNMCSSGDHCTNCETCECDQ